MAPKFVIKPDVSKKNLEQDVKEIRQPKKRSDDSNKAGFSFGKV